MPAFIDSSKAKKPTLESCLRTAVAVLQGRRKSGFAQALDGMGHAPATLSDSLAKPCRQMGLGLAAGGHVDAIEDLVDRGWANALFPMDENDDSLTCLINQPGGARILRSLLASGVKAFGSPGNTSGAGNLLTAAMARQDKDLLLLLHLLDALGIESPGEHRHGSELAKRSMNDARHADLLSPIVLDAPLAWARAVDGSAGSPANAFLEEGRLDLAEALLRADAPAALDWVDTLRIVQWRSPMASLELLTEHGADLLGPKDQGDTPLHRAVQGSKASTEIARRLVELGADPRAKNHDGATPIGLASLRWGAAVARDLFAALPRDFMDSRHVQPFQHGDLPMPLHALRSFDNEPCADDDALLARQATELDDLLAASNLDPRSRDPEFIREGHRLCSSRGLSECMRVLVAHAGPAAPIPRSEDFSGSFARGHGQNARNAGRLACFELALDMGSTPCPIKAAQPPA